MAWRSLRRYRRPVNGELREQGVSVALLERYLGVRVRFSRVLRVFSISAYMLKKPPIGL
jgi:hypothetical protein